MYQLPTTHPGKETGTAIDPVLDTRGSKAPSRRSLVLAGLSVLGVSPLVAGKPGGLNPAIYPGRENQFVAAWTSWSALRERDVKHGTVGADTIALWKVVKSRFKDLDQSLKNK